MGFGPSRTFLQRASPAADAVVQARRPPAISIARAFDPLRGRQPLEAAAHQEAMPPVTGVDLDPLQDLRQQRRP